MLLELNPEICRARKVRCEYICLGCLSKMHPHKLNSTGNTLNVNAKINAYLHCTKDPQECLKAWHLLVVLQRSGQQSEGPGFLKGHVIASSFRFSWETRLQASAPRWDHEKLLWNPSSCSTRHLDLIQNSWNKDSSKSNINATYGTALWNTFILWR